MPEYDVHLAGFDEIGPRTAYLLWQLRESVFVVEQGCPYPELDGRDLEPGTLHVWVQHDGAPVGCLRVLDTAAEIRDVPCIGRVAVALPWRGRGVAESMMRRTVSQLGDRPIRLNAQAHLAGWYARFGFEVSGPEYVEDGIPHVPMWRH